MATRAELSTWTEVVLDRRQGREFNELCRWFARQNLESTIDYVFVPIGVIGDKGKDVFKFKNSSMATLFKLTYGGS